MGKFIIVLVIIFALFYFGGAVLFDSGIAGDGVSRVPAAVQVETVYRQTNKIARRFIKSVDKIIAPARNLFINQASGQGV